MAKSNTKTTSKPTTTKPAKETLVQKAARLERENQELRARNAKDVPVIVTRAFEPMEEQIGQDSVREFTTAAGMGEDETMLTKPTYDIESPEFAEKAANLKFMEDMVTIQIHETAEENAAPYFEIAVNGLPKIFHRGKQYTVKRYFVEGLARAKPVHYKNEEFTQSDGIRSVRWPSRTGLRYSFAVVHDPHPRGHEWLRSVLAQP